MAIDPLCEAPIPFEAVPNLTWIPRRRRGRKLHYSTVFRWYHRGVRGKRLEAIRIGGTLCTSEAALVRFFQCLAEPNTQPHAEPIGARGHALDRTRRRLEAHGI